MALHEMTIHSDGSDTLVLRVLQNGGLEYCYHPGHASGFNVSVTTYAKILSRLLQATDYSSIKLNAAQAVQLKNIKEVL